MYIFTQETHNDNNRDNLAVSVLKPNILQIFYDLMQYSYKLLIISEIDSSP